MRVKKSSVKGVINMADRNELLEKKKPAGSKDHPPGLRKKPEFGNQ